MHYRREIIFACAVAIAAVLVAVRVNKNSVTGTVSAGAGGPLTGAGDPFPEVTVVDLSGQRIQIPVERGYCRYPAEVEKRYNDFVGRTILLMAGACRDIATLRKNGKSLVERSFAVMTLPQQSAPATRPSKADYLANCKALLPSQAKRSSLDDDIEDFNLQFLDHVSIGGNTALGILHEDAEGIFSGLLVRARQGDREFSEIQVLACSVAGVVPLLWEFTDLLDQTTDKARVADKLQAVLTNAEEEVRRTLKINQDALH